MIYGPIGLFFVGLSLSIITKRFLVLFLRLIRFFKLGHHPHISANDQLICACLFLSLQTLVASFLFAWCEDWAWLDSLYFCVITITCIGYGDFAPETKEGRVLAIAFSIFCTGTFAYIVAVLSSRYLQHLVVVDYLRHHNLSETLLPTIRLPVSALVDVEEDVEYEKQPVTRTYAEGG
eukprot:TRINITY_DN6296_c0_g1_i2.p1 TRINITY_DN6296_c0_g1~~TRINITY_DN6296_c0_g1_i2.p1  ORF type:complete len:178 (+),score=5.69 TRINITY_DN6296_c0_g1_i2:77-610(+)